MYACDAPRDAPTSAPLRGPPRADARGTPRTHRPAPERATLRFASTMRQAAAAIRAARKGVHNIDVRIKNMIQIRI